uniref:NADH dehydrogenase subunit 5 n=1 Tax=Venerupis aspera TaxID=2784313 RepID=UPI001BEE9421|nr:NADH dehydrogenase subunit 5 [Venerupis aspera]QUA05877.1 NADH dehydrogenase subunit 5 [Venerupis aspera]
MWVKMFSFFVGSVISIHLFFFFFFFFLFYMSCVMGGSGLVVEWELSEKMVGEMGLCMVVDWVSCLFLMSVVYISGCVSVFSGFYMSHEKFVKRFLYLVQSFVLFMILLILFPSYLGLMVGWDGLGVVSFLLVVYYMNSESLSAGMITALSNRVGDVFFIVAIGVMSCSLSYNVSSGLDLSPAVLGFLVMGGSMTKSAQVPFSAWLPEAMAAPTPVSTLVHSSTLVTAGVYVLIRFGDYLGEFEKCMLMVLSMVTVVLAGSSGCAEVDMKKVVALSTLSQVGMMMFAISLGASVVAFFHLLVHAFFKALMFMCVGGVIFYSGGFQDARYLGGLWYKLPLTSSLLIFSNLSLMGLPFLSGFYSKELIVGSYLLGSCNLVGFGLLFLSLGFTMCYGTRMVGLMLQDMGLCSVSHYKMESSYYLGSLVLMSGGAVGTSVFMQSQLSDLVVGNFMKGELMYGWLVGVALGMLNVCLLLSLSSGSNSVIKLKEFLSSMWFAKHLSGNVISSKFLMGVSYLVSYVEMGWIRGYVWEKGVQEMMMGVSNKVRKGNFNFFGLILFFSFCFVLMIFL